MIIYDIEIKNAIPDEKINPEDYPYISFCNGWTDFEGMGIGIICAYDTSKKQSRVFMNDNLSEFAKLIASNTVCGFNNHHFDDPLCRANDINIQPERSYDLLSEIWRAQGLGTEYNHATHQMTSLSKMIQANFVLPMPKAIPGYMAPVLFQQGQFGRVIDYCMDDVRKVFFLIDRLNQNGRLVIPKTLDLLPIRSPGEYFSSCK